MNLPTLPSFSIYFFLIGIFLAVLVSAGAYKARALSVTGAVAAVILGMLIFGFGGWPWAILLLMFFLTSTMLSKMFKQTKSKAEEKFSKGSQRDIWQVLANGGVSGLAILLQVLFPSEAWPFFLAAGSLAAANADTWATELGVLSKTMPRMITTGKRVEPGTSGAVSLLGSAASLAGAALLGLTTMLVSADKSWLTLLAVTGSGFAGSLIDSLLGATIQAQYYCPACDKITEKHPTHRCGSSTILRSGWSWLNNDVVNGICTLSGGILAVLLLI